MRAKLINSFHGSETYVKTDILGRLSHNQIKRAWRELCGIRGCTCGDVAGCRPLQVLQTTMKDKESENEYQIIDLKEATQK